MFNTMHTACYFPFHVYMGSSCKWFYLDVNPSCVATIDAKVPDLTVAVSPCKRQRISVRKHGKLFPAAVQGTFPY